MPKKNINVKWRLQGLTCAHCAAKIENELGKVEGVRDPVLNFTTSQLSFIANEEATIEEVRRRIKKIAAHVEILKLEDAKKPNLVKENWQMISGTFLFFLGLMLGYPGLLLMAYLLAGFKTLKKAGSNFFRGQVFDENFLMAIATLGAICLGDYQEAVAVMLFYGIGELLQYLAVTRSRGLISGLLDLKVESVHLIGQHGIVDIAIDNIKIGNLIQVLPSERIPLDGVVVEGSADLNMSALTGESMPKYIRAGEMALSGSIAVNGLLKIRVTSTSKTSTIAKIMELVEHSASKKSTSERFITRFSRYYTPAVVGVALGVAIIPTLLFGDISWVYRALVFLVISCPCALMVSIPLAWFAGIGAASKEGILVKGANYLEMLNDITVIAFDKTGTLTEGQFSVVKVQPSGLSADEFLKYAAHAEANSTHPIAKSIIKTYAKAIKHEKITGVQEIPGMGVRAMVDGREVILGNTAPLDIFPEGGDTLAYLYLDGQYKGYLVLRDQVKQSSRDAILALQASGIHVVMLTGDTHECAQKVAAQLGIVDVRASLLPHEKVAAVAALLKGLPEGSRLAFVGDGLNDAPVLALADVGIAMGGLGSDAAIEAADVVLMTDDPNAILKARKFSKKTLAVLYQNIALALGIKLLVMILSLFGLAGLWLAVFADVGVTLLTVLNSIRILKK
ncbi:MAG: cadmium-translocating P-type ATPase [Turicibacter sp.]|nr:cadmium-translocating P-type ATPase [Turicibacter sp.]